MLCCMLPTFHAIASQPCMLPCRCIKTRKRWARRWAACSSRAWSPGRSCTSFPKSGAPFSTARHTLEPETCAWHARPGNCGSVEQRCVPPGGAPTSGAGHLLRPCCALRRNTNHAAARVRQACLRSLKARSGQALGRPPDRCRPKAGAEGAAAPVGWPAQAQHASWTGHHRRMPAPQCLAMFAALGCP